MKKILLLLIFIFISVASLAADQNAELRIYNDEVMIQRFMGVVQINESGDYIFLHRVPQPPMPPIEKYASWRLISLQKDTQTHYLYHLGNYVPANDNCIVPFVNGVMSKDFEYDAEKNAIQFTKYEVVRTQEDIDAGSVTQFELTNYGYPEQPTIRSLIGSSPDVWCTGCEISFSPDPDSLFEWQGEHGQYELPIKFNPDNGGYWDYYGTDVSDMVLPQKYFEGSLMVGLNENVEKDWVYFTINTVQKVPETLPEDYDVSALILLSPN